MKNKAIYIIIPLLLILSLIGVVVRVAMAGSLTPPGTPANTMYTLTDIFNLASGVTGTLGSGIIPTTPVSASPTFQTITSAYTALSTQLSNLSAAKIASGTTAFGITGTLLGDTNAANVLTSALYPGTYNPPVIGNIKSSTSFGSGQTGIFAIGSSGTGFPTTNETVCYDLADDITPISCSGAGTGEDAELAKGIARSYTDNGNGTITDNATGLIWQKCSDGQSSSDCSGGSAATVTWANALTYCNSNTAGLPGSGWYLPNVYQILSLVDFGGSSSPYINTTYFPNTGTAVGYWTSVTTQAAKANASAMKFFTPVLLSSSTKTTTLNVRCVRG
jgi:hypothetical protein